MKPVYDYERMTVTFPELGGEDEEGDFFEEVTVPGRFELCGRCEGRGKHDHPAFSNGITSEEWNGPDWDDDSREGYLSGRYDVSCEECGGRRVVLVPDYERIDPKICERIEHELEADARYEAERRHELKMGY